MVMELAALNIRDVVQKHGPDGWVVAKTDQARVRVPGSGSELCPTRILWRQVSIRAKEMRAIGQANPQAPLFTNPSGERMTEKVVMTEVEGVAVAAGTLLEDDQPCFGTHSMRVAGVIVPALERTPSRPWAGGKAPPKPCWGTSVGCR